MGEERGFGGAVAAHAPFIEPVPAGLLLGRRVRP